MIKTYFLLFIMSLSLNGFAKENPYLFFRELDNNLKALDFYQDKNKSQSPDSIELAYKNLKVIKGLQLKLRLFSDKLNKDIIDRVNQDKPILGQDLTILHKSVRYYLHISSKLLSLSAPFTPKNLDNLDRSLINNNSLESRKNLLWLAIQLNVYEDYLKGYRKWMKFQKLRRIFNAEDISYKIEKNQLQKFIHSLLRKKHINIFIQAVAGFNRYPGLRKNYRSQNPIFAELERELESLEAKEFVSGERLSKNLRKEIRRTYLRDGIKNFWSFGLHHISGFIGNTAGAIKWRKGWLYKRNKVNKEIYSQLEPLDMITEKTPFILTDALIPGHFGHNAIWLGTKEQLIAYGFWNHPSIKPYQSKIEQGYSIIESDRSGTHLKRLEDFMKVDEFAIMRNHEVVNLTNNKIKKIYEVSMSQIGKTYDFNFDVETTDRLVCSELLYQSFGHIAWPTEKYLGRTTISPDNVGELLLYENSPTHLIYYVAAFKKGQLVRKNIKDLAKDLGYRFNQERSLPEKPYFEKGQRRCRKILKAKTSWRNCTTEWKHFVYNKPTERNFPKF